jgi:hypothetical protein
MIYFDDEYHADLVKNFSVLPVFCTPTEIAELAWIVNDYLRGEPCGKTWNTMIKVQKAFSLLAFTHINPTVLYIKDRDKNDVLFILNQNDTGYYLYFSPLSIKDFIVALSSGKSHETTRQKFIDFLSKM